MVEIKESDVRDLAERIMEAVNDYIEESDDGLTPAEYAVASNIVAMQQYEEAEL